MPNYRIQIEFEVTSKEPFLPAQLGRAFLREWYLNNLRGLRSRLPLGPKSGTREVKHVSAAVARVKKVSE